MIECIKLAEILKENELTFFSGIPDSIFKNWMAYLNSNQNKNITNIIAVNECEATAIGAGYHLASKKIPVVYMQNSGLGKIVNPHTSLLSKEVYSIPTIYMIGWRGEPEKKDEPQHKMMGRITLSLLDILEIPYRIFPDNIKEVGQTIIEIKKIAEKNNAPAAIVIKKGLFEDYSEQEKVPDSFEMSREVAIKIISDNLNDDDVIVSTTGKMSRELFEYRVFRNQNARDFYTVGSMGCSSSIALGVALQKKEKRIFVFDGDGATLMQMGTLATIGHYKPKKFYHIIFDNLSYDSTGGQPTSSRTVNFAKTALACGYNMAEIIKTKDKLEEIIKKTRYINGPVMIVVKINKGARKNLGRPTKSPIENKKSFMKFLD